MHLTHLLYVSKASGPFSRHDLRAIVERAAARNKGLGITGLLLHRGGHFMQLLEGDVFTVCELYERILVDPRHSFVNRVIFRPAEARLFPEWRMGLVDLDDKVPIARERIEGLIAATKAGADGPAAVVAMLRGFADPGKSPGSAAA